MSLNLLTLGRLALPTVKDDFKEGVGEPLDVTGAGVALGQRRPKMFAFTVPILPIPDGSNENRLQTALRMRRQLRSMLQNPLLRGQGLYLAFTPDSELNGWVMVGNGQIAYAEGNVVIGNFDLILDEIYKTGGLRTHRPARRLGVTDLRVSSSPRDYLQTLFATDFAAMPMLPLHAMPVGASNLISSTNRALLLATRTGNDGTAQLVVNGTDTDVVDFERPEASFNLGDTVAFDRRGIQKVVLSGHSIATGSYASDWAGVNPAGGTSGTHTLGGLLAAYFMAIEQNWSVNGAAACYDQVAAQTGGRAGGWTWMLKNITRPATITAAPPSAANILFFGVNDIVVLGITRMGPFKEAYRAMLCRMIANATFEETDASITYPAGWSTVTATNWAGNNQVKRCVPGSAVATIQVPSGFLGGTIDLGFVTTTSSAVGVIPTGQAVWTITVDGTVNTTTYTIDGPSMVTPLFSDGGGRNATVYRIKNLSAGAHTITLTLTSESGTLTTYFDYWQTEAVTPPPTALLLQYYGLNNTLAPVDSSMDAMNQIITGIAGEFALSQVTTVPLNLYKNPVNYYSDGLHGVDAGFTVMAGQVEQALPQAEEVYGPDYPWSWQQPSANADCPVIQNSLCRVAFDPTPTIGFQVSLWNGSLWVQQGKVILYRQGDQSGYIDTLLAANVVEWTPERCVIEAMMTASVDSANSRERVYITLQRGWNGPRFEIYASPKADGTVALPQALFFPSFGDTNNSVFKIESGTIGRIAATAGTGSSTFSFAYVGSVSAFNGENWLALLRQNTLNPNYQLNAAVMQAGATAYVSNAGASNYLGVTGGGNGYATVQYGFTKQFAGQMIEAETYRYASGTTSQVADANASGGQAVQDIQTTNAAATVINIVGYPLATYRVFVRARVAGAVTGSYQAVFQGAGPSAQVTTTSTTWVWLDLGEIIPASTSTYLAVYAATSNAATGALIDRIELVKTQDRIATTPTYDGARDLGQQVLADPRLTPVRVER